MASNSSLFVLLLLAAAAAVSSSSADPDISSLLSGLSQGSAVASLHNTMQCMQKLVPCKSYLNVSSTEHPPESCCSPLKQMVSDDFECLCRFYKDPQILKSLNVTRHDALQLPKACHVRLRLSKCSKEASAPITSTATIPTDSATTQAAAAAVIAAVSSANASKDYIPAAASTSSSSSASTKSISYFGVVAVASASLFFMN